ncbi:MAG: DUF5706 domain-containing protein [Novosphingobium sp.]|nr:DUF5706 domain-containing protein [Novosphingobium sp.]
MAEQTDSSLTKYDDTSYSNHAIHLVRTSMMVHMQLSQMADQKASLLMGASFVVFSIAVGQAAAGSYKISLLILALSAFISASFAVAAVVPKVMAKPPTGARRNLLFFGVFTHMLEDDYIDRMMEASETDGRVLSTMARDIYQNGMALQTKKYRLLAYAYRTFQVGLSLTFFVFLYESQDAIAAIFG